MVQNKNQSLVMVTCLPYITGSAERHCLAVINLSSHLHLFNIYRFQPNVHQTKKIQKSSFRCMNFNWPTYGLKDSPETNNWLVGQCRSTVTACETLMWKLIKLSHHIIVKHWWFSVMCFFWRTKKMPVNVKAKLCLLTCVCVYGAGLGNTQQFVKSCLLNGYNPTHWWLS